MNFAAVLRSAEPFQGGFALTVPAEWGQGRTAFGGFSTTLAYRAAIQAGGDGLPPLRSAVVSFVGPLSGAISVTARILRQGRNATWIAAEVLRDDEVGLAATFVFMGPVASTLNFSDVPQPASVLAPELLEDDPFRPEYPAFRIGYDVRLALPPAARSESELCWWVRLRERDRLDAMTEVMLIADALPPGVKAMMAPGVPVSSMTWQVNLLTAAPRTRDGWWLLRSAGESAQAGCSSQSMTIWNTDGEPIASGMQAIALFG
jgi:hypothetical protein